MCELEVRGHGEIRKIAFESGEKLSDVLSRAGILTAHPCGGRGVCGKCAVDITGELSEMTPDELRAGKRLSCQTRLLGGAVLTLRDEGAALIETEGVASAAELHPMAEGVGAAIDIGTTTVAAKLFDLSTGECLGTASRLNPQTAVAADVMGRIGEALLGRGGELREQIAGALSEMLDELGGRPEFAVITGNTTMLYLLTGRSPETLSHAPFQADCLFGFNEDILGGTAYLPPCMNAFVGADITCGVLASGMCGRDETALLCDIGTNGELCLWHGGRLYVTSTAAGPAFEGAGISCGCGSVPGAIDSVSVVGNGMAVHTIGGVEAVGVCGSGLLDAVAAGLALEEIDETGLLSGDELRLTSNIALQQKDIRAVQLAKAAIAAGIATLLDRAGITSAQVEKLYICGGFGSRLNTSSAAAIGLLPWEQAGKAEVLGNAALAGGVMCLLDSRCVKRLEEIAAVSEHVDLGGNPKFNERYMEEMLFPETE